MASSRRIKVQRWENGVRDQRSRRARTATRSGRRERKSQPGRRRCHSVQDVGYAVRPLPISATQPPNPFLPWERLCAPRARTARTACHGVLPVVGAPPLPARASLPREGRSPCAHRVHGIPRPSFSKSYPFLLLDCQRLGPSAILAHLPPEQAVSCHVRTSQAKTHPPLVPGSTAQAVAVLTPPDAGCMLSPDRKQCFCA